MNDSEPLDDDLLGFMHLIENTLEEQTSRVEEIEEEEDDSYIQDTSVFHPQAYVVKRNALRYTKEHRERSLTLTKKAFDLRTTVTYGRVCFYNTGLDPKCVNSECGSSSREFQICPHDGTYVCTSCGAVQHTPIIQEMDPLLWHYNPAHKSEIPAYLVRDPLNTYQPKFHWNEDEKLRRLAAPPIPVFNRECIFWKLDQMGFKRDSHIHNPKLVIQEACRLIDQENGVHVYGRKWGEHWMTIICRYTRGRQRPPNQSDEDRALFASKFDWFYYAWPMCSHLLPGSKKDKVRWQLPQFRWIFRQLLITFTPEEFERWAEWLPVLSKNKEIELDLFWQRMCFVNGWHYRYPGPFIKMIKDKIKKKRVRASKCPLPKRLQK